MKANAPEKIYLIRNISTSTSLNTTNDCHEKYLQEWYKEREKDSDIEYTRTDAFIEKAVDYLNSELYDWVSISNPNQRSCANVIPKKNFIVGFINYMKGE